MQLAQALFSLASRPSISAKTKFLDLASQFVGVVGSDGIDGLGARGDGEDDWEDMDMDMACCRKDIIEERALNISGVRLVMLQV